MQKTGKIQLFKVYLIIFKSFLKNVTFLFSQASN